MEAQDASLWSALCDKTNNVCGVQSGCDLLFGTWVVCSYCSLRQIATDPRYVTFLNILRCQLSLLTQKRW